ncbi:hypothetical protein BO79DRAFT_240450 [Aspergillus costaricaensis CBS 115574]|uniref:Uncharacterized protein n=1 Tax=Aspergillus costaricaensis CBS 115574 TaxID=1448317 RepID=A0ACD1I297_9EURO|nr:hypothetical protein BO79DRAFT_240450 [Aspergillus costaricaensis CBS 115574]RAK84603.1 hypothetical protein BO79DRAFT_240450 [Aspergillus costaricaensis CBS 115574]
MMIPVMIVTWFGISIEACLVCHNILGAIDFGARHSGGASAASFPSENSGPWRGHENLFQIPKSLRRT